jgi:acetyl-CoA synthetase
MSYLDFWSQEAKNLSWARPPTQVHDGRFAFGEWFKGGMINASWNCLDRHVNAGRGAHTALIFESEAGVTKKLSYQDLLELTCDIATNLHNQGISAGDRVAIYMPLVPEAIASMLAVARLGAIHTVVFGGFAHDALAERIADCEAVALITAQQSQRKGQKLELKKTVDAALLDSRTQRIKTVLCFGEPCESGDSRVRYFRKNFLYPKAVSSPQSFEANHPLFILYTSGTTGKPKGIFHATGGYLTHVLSTTKRIFELGDQDLFWCTADIGWITGHSYVTYGPLALGASIFIYEGALNFPTPSRIYELIARHKITVLYTAPTAIRMFMQVGESHKGAHDLRSLRLLGSVGEPINPEAWRWYARVFGENRCPIVDTWWQTETGGMMISPKPPMSNQKPGSAAQAFYGIEAHIVDELGQECRAHQSGFLVIKKPWPGLARGIWGDLERFHETYFAKMPGMYFTGDGAKVDADGDFFIGGRIDDVVNVAGHRLGTAEVESALVAHEAVAEAAVVGIKDDILGQKLVAFVTLRANFLASDTLGEQLKNQVKQIIGSFAKPAVITFVPLLPKTRSGKIMRRLLRALAAGEKITTDISTLEDQNSIAEIKD